MSVFMLFFGKFTENPKFSAPPWWSLSVPSSKTMMRLKMEIIKSQYLPQLIRLVAEKMI